MSDEGQRRVVGSVEFVPHGDGLSWYVVRRSVVEETVAWLPSREAAEVYADRRNGALPKGEGW